MHIDYSKSSTRSIGGRAEDLACNYLKKQGYKIVATNFLIRGGEIDIVAKDGESLVFVEVKARFNGQFGSAREAITPWKLKAMQKCALFYIQNIKWGDRPYRFD